MSDSKLAPLSVLAFALLAGQAIAEPIMTGDLSKLTVFANTYVTSGANTQLLGNVTSGGVETTGAGSRVVGNVISGGAANVGASIVGGDQTTKSIGGFIRSGGLVSTGDGSIVMGDITASGAASVGANASMGGNLVSGGVATAGANAKIAGDFTAVGAGTIGAGAKLGGSMTTGGIATAGVDSSIGGAVKAGGGAVMSNSAAVTGSVSSGTPIGLQLTLTLTPVPLNLTANLTNSILDYVASVASQVRDAQATLSALGFGTKIKTPVLFDLKLTQGIYSAASLSTTAGTTLTLDAMNMDDQTWVFNIDDILAFGGTSTVKVINAGKNNQVFWNVASGYASAGDGAAVVGTIFARDYIMIGANTVVSNLENACGGVFSQTSYVSTGASAIIGGGGCDSPPPPGVPEPASYSLMLAGLGLIGFMVRREKTGGLVSLPLDA